LCGPRGGTVDIAPGVPEVEQGQFDPEPMTGRSVDDVLHRRRAGRGHHRPSDGLRLHDDPHGVGTQRRDGGEVRVGPRMRVPRPHGRPPGVCRVVVHDLQFTRGRAPGRRTRPGGRRGCGAAGTRRCSPAQLEGGQRDQQLAGQDHGGDRPPAARQAVESHRALVSPLACGDNGWSTLTKSTKTGDRSRPVRPPDGGDPDRVGPPLSRGAEGAGSGTTTGGGSAPPGADVRR